MKAGDQIRQGARKRLHKHPSYDTYSFFTQPDVEPLGRSLSVFLPSRCQTCARMHEDRDEQNGEENPGQTIGFHKKEAPFRGLKIGHIFSVFRIEK